jgi:hypothetical protein
MKTLIIAGVMAGSIWLAGCNQPTEPWGSSTPSSASSTNATKTGPLAGTTAATRTVATGTPVIQPILTLWQQGDTTNAINRFLDANWNARPIFPSGMVLSLTETQFKALSANDRQLKNTELNTQVDLMRQLASAVASAGENALAKGDDARARKCFTALGKFGMALDAPDAQPLLRQVGTVSKNMAKKGLSKRSP